MEKLKFVLQSVILNKEILLKKIVLILFDIDKVKCFLYIFLTYEQKLPKNVTLCNNFCCNMAIYDNSA